jgi:hypothetical protein
MASDEEYLLGWWKRLDIAIYRKRGMKRKLHVKQDGK